ncbi:MAG: hypothetical protein ABI595_11035 [Actinomycetota bacterium]
MSTRDLGTIQAKSTSVDRTAGWIFALILAVLFAVSLIATTDAGTTVERAPAAPAFSVGDQLAGGPSIVNRDASPNAGTAWQPVVINGTACHQCR